MLVDICEFEFNCYVTLLLTGSHHLLFQIGHDNWVRAVAFHPSGNYLLSAADDGTIRVWDLKTGRCTRKIDAHGPFVQCLAWGRMMFKGSDDDALARPINVMATGGSDKASCTFVFMSGTYIDD
jgi:platelet-activating factor acetylhydrolase IB subunit alpha